MQFAKMKPLFAIVLLAAAFCAVQAYGSLDQLVQGIKRAKNNVNSITNDLQRFTNNLKYDTGNKLSNKKSEFRQQLNNIVNPALTEIRANVDAAKAQGKNVEHCYTNAKDTLRTLSQTGLSNLNKCEQSGKQQLQSQLNNVQAAQNTGNQLYNELESIMINCYQSDILAMQTCVAIKLGTTNQSIRAYEKTIKSLKSTAQSGSSQIVLSANSCYGNAVFDVRSKTTDVRISASRCINN